VKNKDKVSRVSQTLDGMDGQSPAYYFRILNFDIFSKHLIGNCISLRKLMPNPGSWKGENITFSNLETMPQQQLSSIKFGCRGAIRT